MKRPDIYIIGRGWAALAALWRAQKKNLIAQLVAKENGATQYFSGAFDLIDPRWRAPLMPPWLWPAPESSLADFIQGHPEHLLNEILNHTGKSPSDAVESLCQFVSWLQFPCDGDGKKWQVGFAANGRMKPALFTLPGLGLPAQQLSATTRICILSMPGVPEYPAQLISQELKRYFKTVTILECQELPVFSQAGLTRTRHHFSHSENQNRFLYFLQSKQPECDLLLSPPVLSNSSDDPVLKNFSSALSCAVVEMLSVPPSSAGIKVQNHLQKFIETNFLSPLPLTITDFESDGKTIKSIIGHNGDDVFFTLEAEHFVLASGKFLGGGIVRDENFREKIFDLPLWRDLNSTLDAQTKISALTRKEALDQQPFLGIGVRTDPEARALGPSGVCFENLSVCGHILTGFDFTRERNGFAVSVLSALRCL